MKYNIFTKKRSSIIILTNFFILLFITFVVFEYQYEKIKKEFNYNNFKILKEFSNNISVTKGILSSLSTYSQATISIDNYSFPKITKGLLESYAFVNSISFAPLVKEKDRVEFIKEMRENGSPNYTIKNFETNALIEKDIVIKDIYAPITKISPNSYLNTQYYGFDIFNNKVINKFALETSYNNNVVMFDGIDTSGNIVYLLLKATYNLKDNEINSLKYVNGFYMISVKLDSFLDYSRNEFKGYEMKIIPKGKIKDERNTFFSLINIHKINSFRKSEILIKQNLVIKNFDIFSYLLILFFVIIIQVIYLYYWRKNKISNYIVKYQASHDELTKIYNRNYFRSIFEKKLKNKINSKNSKLALLFIDLDKFKVINDTYGHDYGDFVLKHVANRLNLLLNNDDIVCRHGGDEFLILLDNIKNTNDIILILNKIKKDITKTLLFKGKDLNISLSIGISVYPNDGKNVNELLKNADLSMYRSKELGRNMYSFYKKEMSDKILRRFNLESNLKDAIENNEFLVYYQAQFNARNNKLIGFEALVRWKKDNKIILPDTFIPPAEESGLIIPLERIVMDKAMKQLSIWNKNGLKDITISLNLSLEQLNSNNFIEFLTNTMNQYNIMPKQIELEITENSIMDNPIKSIKKLKLIYDLGIKLSVDDFGTGYSSLSYLKDFPIHKLKIDRSFIKGIPLVHEDVALTKTIISIAKNLNLEVMAEGVETKEQIEFLLNNDCINIQGHYYSKAISEAEVSLKYIKNK